MKRLSKIQELEAMAAFVEYLCDDTDAAIALLDGATVLYRDDYDTGESAYQVVDAQGHGDGSGEWTPVP